MSPSAITRRFTGTMDQAVTYTRESNPANFSTLLKDTGSSYTLKDPSGTTHTFSGNHYTLTDPDGAVHTFDAGGLMRSAVDRNDNVLAWYSYDGSNRLQSI